MAQQFLRHGPGLVQAALADAQLLIHHRGIIENEVPFAGGRAVFRYGGNFPSGQGLRQLHRVLNGGAAQNVLGMAAVKLAQPFQPPEHIGQMTAEHAAVGVNFVDDNVLQIFKQLHPLGMVGQNIGVEHIRVGDHDMARLTDGFPGGVLGIAVVGVGLDIHIKGLDHIIQPADLIGGKRLGGEQIQRSCVLVFQNGAQNGQIIAQGLAAGGGGNDDEVFLLLRQFKALGLMGIQPVNAPFAQHFLNAGIHAFGKIRVFSLRSGQRAPMGDTTHKFGILTKLAQQLIQIHRKAPFPEKT